MSRRGEGSRSSRILGSDPSLCQGQEVEGHEGHVGRNGVCLLECLLAVPESSHHFKVTVGKGRWVAQIGWVAAPSRGSMVASSLSGSPDDD